MQPELPLLVILASLVPRVGSEETAPPQNERAAAGGGRWMERNYGNLTNL